MANWPCVTISDRSALSHSHFCRAELCVLQCKRPEIAAMANVGIVTCIELPEPDPDQDLLLDTLSTAGLEAEMIAWDDPQADPTVFDLCVFRSCWNYHWHIDRFEEWVARAEKVTALANSTDVVRWNLHKRYLRELESGGIPIIPTAWFDQGTKADLRATMNARGWGDVVIKPAISAGSWRTHRFGNRDIEDGQAILDEQLNDHDTLVQRYMQSVEDPGERALIWIDGEVTHGVVKSPRFAAGVEQVSDAVPATRAEQQFAERALSTIDESLIYARVDVVYNEHGELLVSELELIEPSLFFLQCPAALERFVAAIGRHAAALK